MDQQFLDNNNLTPQKASKILDTMRGCLVQCALQGDSVALPGFGTFVTVKEDERIDRDLSTGRQVPASYPHLTLPTIARV